MTAIILALGSSLALGVTDFLGGLKSRSLPQLAVLLLTQGSATVLVATAVIALGASPPGGRYLLYGAAAGIGAAVGVAALYRGLAVGTIGVVAPVAATAPTVPLLASLALGETPTPVQGAGIGLAIAGVVLISRTRRPAADSDARASIAYGLLAAVGFGSGYVAVDAASETSVPWTLLSADLTIVAIFLAAAAIARPDLAAARAELPLLALIGALIAAGDTMYAVASTRGLLGVVAVLGSLYPLVTIALARVYLDERLERAQQLGVVSCVCGILAVSLP